MIYFHTKRAHKDFNARYFITTIAALAAKANSTLEEEEIFYYHSDSINIEKFCKEFSTPDLFYYFTSENGSELVVYPNTKESLSKLEVYFAPSVFVYEMKNEFCNDKTADDLILYLNGKLRNSTA